MTTDANKKATAPESARWRRLSTEALRGAEFAFQTLHSWPRVNGQVLAQIKEFITEIHAEWERRKPEVDDEHLLADALRASLKNLSASDMDLVARSLPGRFFHLVKWEISVPKSRGRTVKAVSIKLELALPEKHGAALRKATGLTGMATRPEKVAP